jgi:REP element-mobilizing transposase RayT
MRPPKFDVEGDTHFVTTNVWHRQPLFVSRAFAQIVLDNLRHYSEALNYELVGYVVMPDHFHALIYPRAVTPISKIMQCVKKYAAKQIIATLRANQDFQMIQFPSHLEYIRRERAKCLDREFPTLENFLVKKQRTENHNFEIWQESFYDFNVFTKKKINEKLDYMHNNPVRWGLAESPADYAFSSFQKWYQDE